jgi:hypothetical protein
MAYNPGLMETIFNTLLPNSIDNQIRGAQGPVYVFTLLALLSTIRSLIHLFAPDGGAESIAGIDLSVAGADGIVFAFGLWGSSQLLFAFIQLLVAFRYRALVPLMYVLLILEMLLRMLVGQMKPITFAHTPPGGVANVTILPLAAAMLL